MPHISSQELTVEEERVIKSRLSEMLRLIGKDKKATHGLRELLSPTEMIMLSKRLAMIYLINEGKSTLDISEILKVSSSTVQRIEKKFDRGGYKNLEKILTKVEPSMLDMLETFLQAGMPPIAGPGRWKFLEDY